MTLPQRLPDSLKADPSLPTTPFSEPWLKRLRAGLGEVNGRPVLMTGLSISNRERERLQGILAQYRSRLTPSPDNRRMMAVVLAKLLAAFPAQAQSDAPAEQRMEAYFEALRDIPAWAVDAAREAIIAGKVAELSGVWAPTPPQLAKVARSVLAIDVGVLADLERIAAAEPVGEIDLDERKRVAAGFDRLRADLVLGGLKPQSPEAA